MIVDQGHLSERCSGRRHRRALAGEAFAISAQIVPETDDQLAASFVSEGDSGFYADELASDNDVSPFGMHFPIGRGDEFADGSPYINGVAPDVRRAAAWAPPQD